MIADPEDFRFLMNMFFGGHLMAARHKTQGCILNRLEATVNETRLDHRAPDASGIAVGRTDEHLESVEEGVLVGSPFGTTHGLQDAETTRRFPPKLLNMGTKCEMGVKFNPKEQRAFV